MMDTVPYVSCLILSKGRTELNKKKEDILFCLKKNDMFGAFKRWDRIKNIFCLVLKKNDPTIPWTILG